MSKKVCSNCRFAIQDTLEMFCLFRKLHTTDGLFENCHCFLPKSVFHRLAQSPEVLAEKLVYRTIEMAVNRVTYSCWKSTITEEAYRTKAEAIAATVEKLKEVER